MAILGNVLPGASGLSRAMSGGAYNSGSSSQGMSFVPNATSTGGISGLQGQIGGQATNLMQGKVSLVMLEGILLGLVIFYVWTHNIQGGG